MLYLVKSSLAENDVTIVSIFVNPSQFAPTEDLDSYPRDLEADLALLSSISLNINGEVRAVDIVFNPTVDEMYPSGIPLDVKSQVGAFVTVQGLSEQLEGTTRPQFFRGVATIVCKLFNIITPTKAYFGQKDIQQTVVVKRMVKDLLLPVIIRVMPTIREATGLALSSRNAYLSNEIKDLSKVFYQALSAGRKVYESSKPHPTKSSDILKVSHQVLESSPLEVHIDYITLSDPKTLTDLDTVVPGVGAILSAAIRVPAKNGKEARLIDNVILD